MIKCYSFLIGAICFTTILFAQSVDKIKFGIGGNLVYTNSINSSNSDAIVPGTFKTYAKYADSVAQYEKGRYTAGISAWVAYSVSQKLSIQTGLSYLDVGFTRVQSNIQYTDSLFRPLGRIEELTLTDKTAEYRYRYHYLHIPIMANYSLYSNRNGNHSIFLVGGMAMNVLLKHDMKAVLDQFVIDGEFVHRFDSTGYDGRRLGLNMMAGVRYEFKDEDKQRFFIQPNFGFSPISVTNIPIRVIPVFFQLSGGIIFAPSTR
jgi:hypothetical protein